MNAQQIQEKMDQLHYWDAQVLRLSSDYFTDEVILAYDDEDMIVTYRFICCYKSNFFHWLGYEKEKPYRDLTQGQIPYFLQDVEVKEIEEEKRKLYSCKILMPPMELEIWCKDIEVSSEAR
ncbi:hypothetical protein QUF99_05520 [Bacillus sp. DX4.1]|uniref:hypothetical protein n=1 Tax=Bacillus sp. DX4.1 TaxID=3055867 RepID=UPI0025A2C18B|nr:hypothetical protein [Bacillus sp. DX4.1]MDM5186831.1 hypothetical protein [Bacillus sp. DX4.1]